MTHSVKILTATTLRKMVQASFPLSPADKGSSSYYCCCSSHSLNHYLYPSFDIDKKVTASESFSPTQLGGASNRDPVRQTLFSSTTAISLAPCTKKRKSSYRGGASCRPNTKPTSQCPRATKPPDLGCLSSQRPAPQNMQGQTTGVHRKCN